jgi:hypothetical protein
VSRPITRLAVLLWRNGTATRFRHHGEEAAHLVLHARLPAHAMAQRCAG